MATTSTTPRQADLLAALNSAVTAPAARKEAKKLLKLWFPMSYQVWTEHHA